MKKAKYLILALALSLLVLTACHSANSTSTNTSTTSTSLPPNSWNVDYATIKYNRDSRQLWVARYNGPGNAYDIANALVVDKVGNTYVTGKSMGSGNGTRYDYTTIKYNKDGRQIWVARYHRTPYGDDEAKAITLDNDGNIIVTGTSVTIKYDTNGHEKWIADIPGEAIAVDGSDNIHVGGSTLVKLDKNGKTIWSYAGPRSPIAIAIDKEGNTYVSGFDATIKYDVNGNQLWSISSLDGGGFAMDSAGNIYLGERFIVSKYDSNGKRLWVSDRYQFPADSSYNVSNVLALDKDGNVYIAGRSVRENADNRDYTIIKYNNSGKYVWVAHYNDDISTDNLPWGLYVDASGNIYITGKVMQQVLHNFLEI